MNSDLIPEVEETDEEQESSASVSSAIPTAHRKINVLQQKVWVNRIVEYRVIDPEQLLANPDNWRVHPEHQKQSMTDILDFAGWVQGIVVNINTDVVVDGHLRVALCLFYNVREIPVCYVDLTPEIEEFMLYVYDQIGKEAVPDYEKLSDLYSRILDKLPGNFASLHRLIENWQENSESFETLREARENLISSMQDDPATASNPNFNELWKYIKVKVTAETYERYDQLFAQMPGDNESAKMSALVEFAEMGFNSLDNVGDYEPSEAGF